MTISCLRQSPRARCAPCFERTGFRQPCSLFPSYLRCDSLRSIAACSHNRPSCTCRWPFRQQQQKPALQSQLTAGPQRRKSISIPLCVPPKAIPITEEMYQCDLPTASRSNCTARLVSIALPDHRRLARAATSSQRGRARERAGSGQCDCREFRGRVLSSPA
jgi:hypothetical protein